MIDNACLDCRLIAGGEMDTKPQKLSHAELIKLRTPVKNANLAHKETLTRLEKFSLAVTEHIGTMGFFFVVFAWTALWLGWNTLAPQGSRFDPLPRRLSSGCLYPICYRFS